MAEPRKTTALSLKRARVSCGTEPAARHVCPVHNAPLNVYCCADEQVLCSLCALIDHKGHRTQWASEERRRKQVDLNNIRKASKERLKLHEEEWKKLEENLTQIQEGAREAEGYCESIIARLIDCLQRRYGTVQELIEARERAAVAEVQSSLQSLEGKIEEIKEKEIALDRQAQTDDDVAFLQTWHSLSTLCEPDGSPTRDFEDPLLPFEGVKRAVQEFGRQLEAFCDKGFIAISQSGQSTANNLHTGQTIHPFFQQKTLIRPPGYPLIRSRVTGATAPPESSRHPCPEQHQRLPPGVSRDGARPGSRCNPSIWSLGCPRVSSNPKTRAEFLAFACEVTFDPNTAHKDLVLSKNDREVNVSHHDDNKCRHQSEPHAERFTHRRQLLCAQGLSNERCYYEVEVYGDKAEIALAYREMDRRSKLQSSAFGGNNKSWSLDRSKVYSVSHDGDAVQLSTSPRHRRVGVYLDHKEGALTFYEVSESMTFLYRVEATFTEPLYPGFWLGDKCCIRLCDLRQQDVVPTG